MASTITPRRLTIATRESALAMWQAQHIRERLAALHPDCVVELLGLTTQGDRILDQPLADIGGKGLFIKELEIAMAEGRADLAVHSLKDVPMEMPDGFVLAAITAREDPRDAFVSNHYLDLAQLPGGARVGTSSLRREAQLRERDPLLAIEPLRGNVNTRLRKLDEGRYDGDHPRRGGPQAPGLRRAHRVAARSRREPARGRAGCAGARVPGRPPRRDRRARPARRPRDHARDDRRARVLAGAGGQLPHAARRARDAAPRRDLAARAARLAATARR